MLSLAIFSILWLTVSASGHLRLDLTPSNNCAIRIVTNILHAESYWLTMGEEWTTKIRPLHGQERIRISFSIDGGAPEEEIYEFKKAGIPQRNVFTFNDVAVLVEATFECDEGFSGSRCQRKGSRNQRRLRPRAPTTIAAISSTTTSTAVPEGSGNVYTILILIFVLILDVVLITILIQCYCTNRTQEVVIEPSGTPELKKKDMSMDSGISTGTPRYTLEPSTVVSV